MGIVCISSYIKFKIRIWKEIMEDKDLDILHSEQCKIVVMVGGFDFVQVLKFPLRLDTGLSNPMPRLIIF